jgi:DNA adenine methylase
MLLRLQGNKQYIAKEIQRFFAPHDVYVEPFFGAGGMFFNKNRVPFNVVNDIDGDVFNLYQIVSTRKDELIDEMRLAPMHSDLLEHWKKNKETDPLKKALRFLFMNNYTLYSAGNTMRTKPGFSKSTCLKEIDRTFHLLQDVHFFNKDFRVFIKSLAPSYAHRGLIYADPPYIGSDSYNNNFTEQDSRDLFDALQASGYKWVMSEFDTPFILEEAQKRKLNVESVAKNRTNLKNKRSEILILNYKPLNKFPLS